MISKLSRRNFLRQATVLAAAPGVLGTAWGADPKYVVAETTFGKIRGVDTESIKIFKGITYGASTAGRNRFMPPVNPAKWTGVRDALEYGHSAPQTEPGTRRATSDLAVAGAGLTNEGEDCLVLNIWTPGINDGRKRPVMLWCHGGGFSSGSGSSPVTEGTNLARRGDVVVVTINHFWGLHASPKSAAPSLRNPVTWECSTSCTRSSGCAPTSLSSAAIRIRSPSLASRGADAK
jgi:para-nitrobenzyl esterase